MTIEDFLNAGQLTEAIEFQNGEVRKRPTDPDARFVLFALLVYTGNLERAMKQLEALVHLDASLAMGCRMYQNLLVSEESRRKCYKGEDLPILPPESPDHIVKRSKAFTSMRKGDSDTFSKTIMEIGETGCALNGQADGMTFCGIRDYDDLLGPILEVYAGGKYLWIPFEQIKKLETPEPTNMLDLLWLQAKIESIEGENFEVHIPALYNGSCEQEDPQIKLGRKTEWVTITENYYTGLGQKILLLATDGEAEEKPLLSLRKLEMT